MIESRNLSKHEELVPAYVFAVGHDAKFIFAKQHPVVPNAFEKIDTAITNYYIIERTKNEFQDKLKYGPLTRMGFDSLCSRLKIRNTDFDLTFPTDL